MNTSVYLSNYFLNVSKVSFAIIVTAELPKLSNSMISSRPTVWASCLCYVAFVAFDADVGIVTVGVC